MRRAAAAAAALAASILLASCGGGGGGGPAVKPPQGPPSARHPASEIAAELAGEQMRAHLLVAARLYNNGRFQFATDHMAAAEANYRTIAQAVRTRDSVLDREFNAAFGVIAGQIAQRAQPLTVTNRMGILQGQFLDAAIQDSVSKPAFNDPGVAALVMMRLANQAAREYALSARVGNFTPRGKRAYQDAFGLLTRASSISHRISPSLGPQRNAIVNGITDAHGAGFLTGVLVPRHLHPAQVAAGVRRAEQGVLKRFGFTA
ncbi:MAG TPA: hypothetical protein VF032_08840 [Thermoleophilaceae bacterium]